MSTNTRKSLRGYQLAGFAGILVIMGSVVGWSVLTEIRGAIIAPGSMVVDGNTKRIQHRDGGIVAEIKVHDGDMVQAGDLLVRLDPTETKAELGIIDAIRTEWVAKAARLRTQRDGDETLVFDDELEARRDEAQVRKLLSGQESLFAAQTASLKGRKKQLRERISQFKEEIIGVEAQLTAKVNQKALIEKELTAMRDLLGQGLVQITRVLGLEREQERLAGETGQHRAEIARARGQIGEVEIQILQLQDDALSTTLTELREAESKIAEFDERRIAVSAKLKRVEIRSPRNGFVHQLAVHTIGGVIAPGEAVMMIVPEEDPLIVEANVRPQDIDQVFLGQEAIMRFPNAVSTVTPQILGRVSLVSADLKQPEPSQPPFYTVRLKLDEKEKLKLNGLELKAGMPAEAYMQTSGRSPLSYLLKPFRDQLNHAFRER